MGARAANELEEAVLAENQSLEALVERALDAPAEREQAFRHLATSRSADQAVVLFRGDTAFAWGGRSHALVDTGANGGVVGTPFYLGLYAAKERNGARAVATRVLFAVSPADRIASSLAGLVASANRGRRVSIRSTRGLRVARAGTRRARRRARVVRGPRRASHAGRGAPARARARPPARRRPARRRVRGVPGGRMARVARPSSATRTRRGWSRVRRLHSAQRLLQLHAAVRSGPLLHAAGRTTDRERGGAWSHERAGAPDAPRGRAAPDLSPGSSGGDRNCPRRRGRGTVPPPRSGPWHSDPDVRRQRRPLVDLGGAPLPRRRGGDAGRRGRRQRCAGPIARTASGGRPHAGRGRVAARARGVASAGTMALVVHIPLDRRDRVPGGVAANDCRHRGGRHGGGARRDDAGVGSDHARAGAPRGSGRHDAGRRRCLCAGHSRTV